MEKIFGIIPATSGAYAFLWGFGIFIGVILIGIIGLFVSFGYQARHAAFTLTDEGLRISPGLYSRTIPKENIDAAGVKVINLDMEKDYQPKWRTNGAGLPGYSAGWYKLQNKEKALLFVTDRSSVVYIPTTENYSVMLSVREADEMVELIQQWGK
jgi:hypothetical protein